jgi:hypothetical protein
MEKLHKVMQR